MGYRRCCPFSFHAACSQSSPATRSHPPITKHASHHILHRPPSLRFNLRHCHFSLHPDATPETPVTVTCPSSPPSRNVPLIGKLGSDGGDACTMQTRGASNGG
ncbi:hypothetical protein RIF29_28498 [Crotalaria pallida]|uniref:Uncharacterized protein n=1 Tax=Crotalaria pallida TaxID=3830 RepID=A0AAN9EEW7_CROPI